ncbi:MAG: hypothetical protein ACRCZF_15850 [Gemmataceae bacterium]
MLRLAGVVMRSPDPIIARPTWLLLIAEHNLRPIQSFPAICPFTHEPVQIGHPDREPAAVVRRGKRVGVVVWTAEGKGLDIYGDPAVMAEVAIVLAAGIGGEYEPEG